MFPHNKKYFGKIQELNNLYRFKAREDSIQNRVKIKDLKNKFNIPSLKDKPLFLNNNEKRSNVSSSMNHARVTITPMDVMSPLQHKGSIRMNTTRQIPRKTDVSENNFHYRDRKHSLNAQSKARQDNEARQSADESNNENDNHKAPIRHQISLKPEVTISEYEINKKWYDYEK